MQGGLSDSHQASLFSIFQLQKRQLSLLSVGGFGDGPEFGFLSSGVFLMRYQSISATNFTAGAGLHGHWQVFLKHYVVALTYTYLHVLFTAELFDCV